MKKNLLPIIIVMMFSLLLMNFSFKHEEEMYLELDEQTFVEPIIEKYNGEKNIEFICKIKVDYKDLLEKPIKLQNGDKLRNRCSYESQIVFYSEKDSLVLSSWRRMSCEITAFFTVKEKDNLWFKSNKINAIKIINITTDSELKLKNNKPNLIMNLFNKYNYNIILDN